MPWLILMLISWVLVLLLVRNPGIGRLWPAGLAAVIVTIILDTNLVRLGAFKFNNTLYHYHGVPLLYVLGNFANGILLTRFVPAGGILKPVLTVGLASLFLLLEWAAIILGYFEHLNWSMLHSLGLNIIGFITVLWIADLFNLRRKRDVWASSPLLKRIKN